MVGRKRSAGLFVGGAAAVLLGLLSAFAVAAPANAVVAGHKIGASGYETRCRQSGYKLCLYYQSGMSTAYWGTTASVRDLTGYKFFSGTGTGAGQNVENNAAAMVCMSAPTGCCSYDGSGFGGNYDWEYPLQKGVLFYTWNNEASVKVV